MDRIDELLKYVQKTNPGMTKERLVEELSKCRCSTTGLITVYHSGKKAYIT